MKKRPVHKSSAKRKKAIHEVMPMDQMIIFFGGFIIIIFVILSLM